VKPVLFLIAIVIVVALITGTKMPEPDVQTLWRELGARL